MFAIFRTDWNSKANGHTPRLRQEELKEDRQKTHTDWQYSPQQPLPGRGNRVRLNFVRGRNVLFRPGGDFAVTESLNLSPSNKGEQRLVIGIVHKDIFQAIAVSMFEHRPKRSHAGRAIEFRVSELRRSVMGHLGQEAGGIVVSIHAAGI